MQMVINIDDTEYEEIIYLKNTRPLDLNHYDRLIANGTPLPKNHGRLIDADVLADGFEDNYEFCEAINATPTIIEASNEK